jgi:hypothetical protein
MAFAMVSRGEHSVAKRRGWQPQTQRAGCGVSSRLARTLELLIMVKNHGGCVVADADRGQGQ